MFLVSKWIGNRHLKHVFAERYLAGQLYCASDRNTLQVGLVAGIERRVWSRVEGLAVEKDSQLYPQLRLGGRLVEARVVDHEGVLQRLAALKQPRGRTS